MWADKMQGSPQLRDTSQDCGLQLAVDALNAFIIAVCGEGRHTTKDISRRNYDSHVICHQMTLMTLYRIEYSLLEILTLSKLQV